MKFDAVLALFIYLCVAAGTSATLAQGSESDVASTSENPTTRLGQVLCEFEKSAEREDHHAAAQAEIPTVVSTVEDLLKNGADPLATVTCISPQRAIDLAMTASAALYDMSVMKAFVAHKVPLDSGVFSRGVDAAFYGPFANAGAIQFVLQNHKLTTKDVDVAAQKCSQLASFMPEVAIGVMSAVLEVQPFPENPTNGDALLNAVLGGVRVYPDFQQPKADGGIPRGPLQLVALLADHCFGVGQPLDRGPFDVWLKALQKERDDQHERQAKNAQALEQFYEKLMKDSTLSAMVSQATQAKIEVILAHPSCDGLYDERYNPDASNSPMDEVALRSAKELTCARSTERALATELKFLEAVSKLDHIAHPEKCLK